jgi:hypothetical protein
MFGKCRIVDAIAVLFQIQSTPKRHEYAARVSLNACVPCPLRAFSALHSAFFAFHSDCPSAVVYDFKSLFLFSLRFSLSTLFWCILAAIFS